MSEPTYKYTKVLDILKERIKNARLKAVLTVNVQLLAIYWEIGNAILEQLKEEGWGTKVIPRIAKDLKAEFPDMKGLSERNIKYMRAFAEAYPHFSITLESELLNPASPKDQNQDPNAIVQVPLAQLDHNLQSLIMQVPLAQLTWYHHITLLDKVKDEKERLFYLQKTIDNGWSRNVMVAQIESELYYRQGKILSNFQYTLSKEQSDLSKETFKSPYVFDFLAMGDKMQERELENALILHLKNFMLELGKGFAYVGNQFNLKIDGDDFFLDLLFYNYNLHCFVVFELKIDEFKAEYTGKLNLYINSVNKFLRGKEDNPTIGVLLCKTPNKTVVQLSLEGNRNPMGVSEYQFSKIIPKELKGEMPSIKELEAEIEKSYEELKGPLEKRIDKVKNLIKDLKEPEVQIERNEESLQNIFNNVLIPLKAGILEKLAEISQDFKVTNIMIWTDGQGYNEEEKALQYLKSHIYLYELRLDLQLKGFIHAGTKAFDLSKSLSIMTDQYKYSIGFDRFKPEEILLEKLYHQIPGKDELRYVIAKWAESILDNLEQHLERIKGPGN